MMASSVQRLTEVGKTYLTHHCISCMSKVSKMQNTTCHPPTHTNAPEHASEHMLYAHTHPCKHMHMCTHTWTHFHVCKYTHTLMDIHPCVWAHTRAQKQHYSTQSGTKHFPCLSILLKHSICIGKCIQQSHNNPWHQHWTQSLRKTKTKKDRSFIFQKHPSTCEEVSLSLFFFGALFSSYCDHQVLLENKCHLCPLPFPCPLPLLDSPLPFAGPLPLELEARDLLGFLLACNMHTQRAWVSLDWGRGETPTCGTQRSSHTCLPQSCVFRNETSKSETQYM